MPREIDERVLAIESDRCGRGMQRMGLGPPVAVRSCSMLKNRTGLARPRCAETRCGRVMRKPEALLKEEAGRDEGCAS